MKNEVKCNNCKIRHFSNLENVLNIEVHKAINFTTI